MWMAVLWRRTCFLVTQAFVTCAALCPYAAAVLCSVRVRDSHSRVASSPFSLQVPYMLVWRTWAPLSRFIISAFACQCPFLLHCGIAHCGVRGVVPQRWMPPLGHGWVMVHRAGHSRALLLLRFESVSMLCGWKPSVASMYTSNQLLLGTFHSHTQVPLANALYYWRECLKESVPYSLLQPFECRWVVRLWLAPCSGLDG